MKATLPLLAMVLAAVDLAPAQAHWPPYGCPVPVLPQAPDACGPGYYDVNTYGQVYGPNYWLVPPTGPCNGAIFARQAAGYPGRGPGFPTHPFARSPRDFFMME